MVRQSLETDPELPRRGPETILHVIIDRIVDDYGPVVDGLENDIQETEAEVFWGERTPLSASTSCRVGDPIPEGYPAPEGGPGPPAAGRG